MSGDNIEMLKDIAAESAVIGSILAHPDYIYHTDWLKAKHFYAKENGAMYWACCELIKKKITEFDAINLNNQLHSNSAVEKIMEQKNLSDINTYIELSKYAARDQVSSYVDVAKTVATYAYKRELYKKSYELQRKCFDDDATLTDLDKAAHRTIANLSDEFLFDNDIKPISEAIDDIFQDIIDAQGEDGISGFPSKFKIFDPYFTYMKSELVVVAARMKSAKSCLLMNEAIHKASNGVGTLIIDTEMSSTQWTIRAISMLSQVKVKRIRDGNWSYDEKQKILKAKNFLASLNLIHYYMPVPDIDKVYSLCKMMQVKCGIEFIVYDYIKADLQGASELSNELGRMVTVLKNEICGELGLAGLAAVQLSRNNEISSSDKIAMYASTIVKWRLKTGEEIAKDGGFDYGSIYCWVELNRNGDQQSEDDKCSLVFKGDTMTISDCEQPNNSSPFIVT